MDSRNDADKTIISILNKHPGKQRILLGVVEDAIELSDGGVREHLHFVCDDLAESLKENETGIVISGEELMKLCNAVLAVGTVFEYD